MSSTVCLNWFYPASSSSSRSYSFDSPPVSLSWFSPSGAVRGNSSKRTKRTEKRRVAFRAENQVIPHVEPIFSPVRPAEFEKISEFSPLQSPAPLENLDEIEESQAEAELNLVDSEIEQFSELEESQILQSLINESLTPLASEQIPQFSHPLPLPPQPIECEKVEIIQEINQILPPTPVSLPLPAIPSVVRPSFDYSLTPLSAESPVKFSESPMSPESDNFEHSQTNESQSEQSPRHSSVSISSDFTHSSAVNSLSSFPSNFSSSALNLSAINSSTGSDSNSVGSASALRPPSSLHSLNGNTNTAGPTSVSFLRIRGVGVGSFGFQGGETKNENSQRKEFDMKNSSNSGILSNHGNSTVKPLALSAFLQNHVKSSNSTNSFHQPTSNLFPLNSIQTMTNESPAIRSSNNFSGSNSSQSVAFTPLTVTLPLALRSIARPTVPPHSISSITNGESPASNRTSNKLNILNSALRLPERRFSNAEKSSIAPLALQSQLDQAAGIIQLEGQENRQWN